MPVFAYSSKTLPTRRRRKQCLRAKLQPSVSRKSALTHHRQACVCSAPTASDHHWPQDIWRRGPYLQLYTWLSWVREPKCAEYVAKQSSHYAWFFYSRVSFQNHECCFHTSGFFFSQLPVLHVILQEAAARWANGGTFKKHCGTPAVFRSQGSASNSWKNL